MASHSVCEHGQLAITSRDRKFDIQPNPITVLHNGVNASCVIGSQKEHNTTAILFSRHVCACSEKFQAIYILRKAHVAEQLLRNGRALQRPQSTIVAMPIRCRSLYGVAIDSPICQRRPHTISNSLALQSHATASRSKNSNQRSACFCRFKAHLMQAPSQDPRGMLSTTVLSGICTNRVSKIKVQPHEESGHLASYLDSPLYPSLHKCAYLGPLRTRPGTHMLALQGECTSKMRFVKNGTFVERKVRSDQRARDLPLFLHRSSVAVQRGVSWSTSNTFVTPH